jgi:hypothetical protein
MPQAVPSSFILVWTFSVTTDFSSTHSGFKLGGETRKQKTNEITQSDGGGGGWGRLILLLWEVVVLLGLKNSRKEGKRKKKGKEENEKK